MSKSDFSRRWGRTRPAILTPILGALILGIGVLPAAGLRPAARAVDKAEGPTVAVRTTVTVLPIHGMQAPGLPGPTDLQVLRGHNSYEVTSLVAAQGPQAAMQLLILVDDSSRFGLASQLNDLRHFILALPRSTQVGVGYMYNGSVNMVAPFGSSRNTAASSLHPPVGAPGAASPYFSLEDLQKKWEVDPTFPRREILLISDGSDPYEGRQIEDPYVDDAIAAMQRQGLQVFTLFTPGVDTRRGGYWGGTYLLMLSQGTGGQSLYSGYGAAVSFTPFLNDLAYILQHQYLVTFQARQEKKGGLQKIKVTTDVPNARVTAPEQVYVPGVEE